MTTKTPTTADPVASAHAGSNLPLGRSVDYPRAYDATLLFPIARTLGREPLGVNAGSLPFIGNDRWHAYELGWLDARGKPRVATATITVPADSPNLIESKSLKLYLNSFNATAFDHDQAVLARIVADLSTVAGGPVQVSFGLPAMDEQRDSAGLIDDLAIDIDHYGPPQPAFIAADPASIVTETLTSELLKSNCPVTGQPDWARLVIRYHGPQLDRAGLLRYLVSFRDHAGFHEQCVEQVFCDLMRHARPTQLSVEARYTRRGGLDINPWRATPGYPAPTAGRDLRQ